MKNLHVLLLLLGVVCGAALVLLDQILAPWSDKLFFPQQFLLGRANGLLKEGKTEDFEEALRTYILDPEGAPKLRAWAFFNLGNCALDKALRGDSSAAQEALFCFREALRNDPSLFPAKHNLELLMKAARNDDRRQEDPSSPRESKAEEGRQPLFKGHTTRPPYLGSSP